MSLVYSARLVSIYQIAFLAGTSIGGWGEGSHPPKKMLELHQITPPLNHFKPHLPAQKSKKLGRPSFGAVTLKVS